MKILISRMANGYRASLESRHEDVWADGDTSAEAIGVLVELFPGYFNVVDIKRL